MQKRHPPPHSMQLPISLESYRMLLSASCDSGFEKEDWEIGELAIQEWMVRNSPDAFKLPETSGYQWKHLFLPNGTLLRTVFNGKNYHCLVEQDNLIFEAAPTSPSRFANAAGGSNRNAWKVIWILFPNTRTWKLAASLRPKKNPRRRKA